VPKRHLGRGADCGGDGLQFDLDEGLEHAGAVAVPLGGHLAMPAHTLESDGTATECDGDSASSSAFGSHASSANGDWMAMGGHASRSPASRPRPAAPSARHPGVAAWSPRRGGRSAPRPMCDPSGHAGGAAGEQRPVSAGLLGRSLAAAGPVTPGHGGSRRAGASMKVDATPAPSSHDGGADCAPTSPAAASFSDVPAEAWPAFMAAFVPLLDAALRQHAAAASAGGARATQLLTRGGTRLEAFGTSCPNPTGWMDMERRR
jgi:hypothetical protein